MEIEPVVENQNQNNEKLNLEELKKEYEQIKHLSIDLLTKIDFMKTKKKELEFENNLLKNSLVELVKIFLLKFLENAL